VPGYASSISYHPSGLVHQVVHTNGVTFTQGADPFGMRRPGSLGVTGQSFQNPSLATGVWGQEGGLVYRYDGAGNVTGLATENYVYDEVNRVTYGKLGTAADGNRQSYTYDAFGNLTSITTVRGGASSTPLCKRNSGRTVVDVSSMRSRTDSCGSGSCVP
jgi:YD repeat-containing protein